MLRASVTTSVVVEPLFGSQAENLGVPTILQVRNFWCWAACMTMVERLNGKATKMCEIAGRFVGTDCCGAAFDEEVCDVPLEQSLIAPHWGSMGYNSELSPGALDFEQVKQSIGQNEVVQAALFYVTGGGHVVLITGWETDENAEDWLLVDDPYDGEAVVKFSDFRSSRNGSIWLNSWRIEVSL